MDMRLSWEILVPGGFMLVHDCFPPGHVLSTVRDAIKAFSREVNVPWTLIANTMYMAAMRKPTAVHVTAAAEAGVAAGKLRDTEGV